MKIRHIEEKDWDGILVLQEEVYPPDLAEGYEPLSVKVKASPETCFVAEENGSVVGYVIACPCRTDNPPGINAVTVDLSCKDELHIHDMAVKKTARGGKIGLILNEMVFDKARDAGYAAVSLVAVNGADRYWQNLGYTAAVAVKDMSDYGGQAVYMKKNVS